MCLSRVSCARSLIFLILLRTIVNSVNNIGIYIFLMCAGIRYIYNTYILHTMQKTNCKRKCITLDSASDDIIRLVVPGKYPSASEFIRDLIRKEGERIKA